MGKSKCGTECQNRKIVHTFISYYSKLFIFNFYITEYCDILLSLNNNILHIKYAPMTVLKYNNCEFSGQNTTEYRSTLSGVGGWVK